MTLSAKQKAARDGKSVNTNPMRDITPEQAETWVENNVNDLATAKIVLKKIARLLAAHDRKLQSLED
jgi:hypothetical protein